MDQIAYLNLVRLSEVLASTYLYWSPALTQRSTTSFTMYKYKMILAYLMHDEFVKLPSCFSEIFHLIYSYMFQKLEIQSNKIVPLVTVYQANLKFLSAL
jgi:hypothetical protein